MAKSDLMFKLMLWAPRILNKKVLYGIVALSALLIALRAFDVVDWSWWLVTLPIWLPVSLVLIILIFLVVKFRSMQEKMGGPQNGKRK